MKTTGSRVLLLILLILAFGGFLYLMNYLFEHTEIIPEIFSGSTSEQVLGRVAVGSDASIASHDRAFAKIAMFIFSTILSLQAVAFALACAVVHSIRRGSENAKLRIKQLENADIFFDVPLYLGLFGTVSGFLIMVFSTQSSLVIAYTSTLFGIVLSLLLRLGVLYPLRKKLLSATSGGDEK